MFNKKNGILGSPFDQKKDKKFVLHGTFQQIDYYSELARVRVIVHP